MLLHTFPQARIHFYALESVLELEWLDFVTGAAFQQIVTHALDLAHTHRARRWLSNDMRLRPVRAADQQWMFQTVLPRMSAMGFVRLAGVLSVDPMAQMAVEDFTAALSASIEPLPVRLFATRREAWAWLTEAAAVRALV